ncbi:MAG: UDP-glucose dehydrogenase family protein, partial [Ilumatobacteraceae bacterium]
NKSTVPVGTTTVVDEVIQRSDIAVVSHPEFLREGTAVNDFLHPDRVVVGADDRSAAEKVAALYESIDTQVIITDAASAETIKYAANGFLAMKISFVNAVAAMCEAVGADVVDVVEGIGSDRRIGREFLRPGPGWGGSCFPKDSHALVHVAASHGYDFSMMRGVIAVNDEQRERMVRKVQHAAGTNDLNGMTISVLGLTFKAGTDDLRDSPSLAVINRLRELGATVKAYDPTTTGTLSQIQQSFLSGISVQQSIDEAMSEGDVLVILTEWPEFMSLDLERAKVLLSGSAIVDTRNLLNPQTVRAAGLTYDGVGRLA